MVSSNHSMRRGFTLVEVMLVSALSALVFGGLASFIIGSHRMVRDAFQTVELSINMRLLREKLLFHAQPVSDGVVWSGLLSGSGQTRGAGVLSGSGIAMASNGVNIETGRPVLQSIDIGVEGRGTASAPKRFLVNDSGADGGGDSWLIPSADLGYFDNHFEVVEVDGQKILQIDLLAAMNKGTNGVVRAERITVPVFGTFQGASGSTEDESDGESSGSGASPSGEGGNG